MRIHPGRDNAHLLVVDPVKQFQLRALRLSRGNDAVRGLHHCQLPFHPCLPLALLGRSADALLHQAQGVEHLQHWNAPIFLEDHPGQTGHPIVAVDQIIPNPFALGKSHDPLGKRFNITLQFIFLQIDFRPGRDMDYPVEIAEVM